MNLNGEEYFYIRNAQGDIIGLCDKSGVEVVRYSYDSFGKLTPSKIESDDVNDIEKNGITGLLATTVGVKNPYRYRGYRYDNETGLYYLQSRYYNPSWGRFLNADAIIGSAGELLGHNVFAYCKNNVVNGKDPSGFITIYTEGQATEEMVEAGYKAMNTAAKNCSSNNQSKTSSTKIGKNGAKMKNEAKTVLNDSFAEAKKQANNPSTYFTGGLIVLATSTIIGDKKGRNAGVLAGVTLIILDTYVSKGNLNAMFLTPFIAAGNWFKYGLGDLEERFDRVTLDANSFKDLHPRGCDR